MGTIGIDAIIPTHKNPASGAPVDRLHPSSEEHSRWGAGRQPRWDSSPSVENDPALRQPGLPRQNRRHHLAAGDTMTIPIVCALVRRNLGRAGSRQDFYDRDSNREQHKRQRSQIPHDRSPFFLTEWRDRAISDPRSRAGGVTDAETLGRSRHEWTSCRARSV